ncbi:alpha/beta fold hydrolase [Candidatus Roizmanbacteria bacterium]|nr:alpha/beta fold hydrolase [Candidatus Roizmanbacteria bacterium]
MSLNERVRGFAEETKQKVGSMAAIGLLALSLLHPKNAEASYSPDIPKSDHEKSLVLDSAAQPFSGTIYETETRISIVDRETRESIPFWDGTNKDRYSPNGLKVVLFTGMGTSANDNTFQYVVANPLRKAGINERNILPMTYQIDKKSFLLGKNFTREDSTQRPDKSLANMEEMMKRIMKDFPKDRFIFIGHSQGGFLAHKLALKFSDRVAAVITLDGALKGSDIVPTPADRLVAPIIGGEAASYFLARAANRNADAEIEREVKQLIDKGIFEFTFGSTQDLIVGTQYAVAKNASTEIGGKKLQLSFPMEEWTEWRNVTDTEKHLQEQSRFLDMILSDSRTAGDSARLQSRKAELTRRIRGGLYGHAAVLHNPKVLESIQTIVEEVVRLPHQPICVLPGYRPGTFAEMSEKEFFRHEENAGVRLLNKLPYRGKHFFMDHDYSRAVYIVKIPRSDFYAGYRELNEFLRTVEVTGTEMIRVGVELICN